MSLPAHESSSPVPPTRGRLDELKNPQLWSVASTLGAITMMWTTYNEYVPQFLTGVFALPALVVVLVLTLDNMLGFFMEPVTGLLSDQTITRWGRRLPWILGAMPVAVACLALLPLPALAAQSSLRAMLNPFALFVVGMLVAMALLRTPTVALMPDLVDSPGRPIANGLLQTLSGAGTLAALWVGGWLVEHFGAAAPFWLASATMVVATLLLWRTLRRREEAPPERLPSPHPAAPARRTERLALMGAITGWWLGYLFLNALFGDYAARRWNLSQDQSALLLRLFLLSYAIAALPVSLLAERWARRRTVLLCTGLLLGAIGALLLPIPLPLAVGLLVAVGIGWAGVTVHSLPMLLDMGSEARLGTSTGLYYLAFAVAGLAGPWLLRALRPMLGEATFWLVPGWWALALLLVLWLRPGMGEAQPSQPALVVSSTES